jgi:putative membrane protein
MMKFRSWRFLALAMSVLAFTACNKDDDDDLGLDQMSAAEFVQKAAASDVFEIGTGELAVNKSETEGVRDLGQTLVSDHTNSSKMLLQLVRKNNINVVMPTKSTLGQDKLAIMARLAQENGAAFDQDFANTQVKAHQEAIALFEEAAREVHNKDLKAFAAQTLPILKMHLQHAKDLQDQLED